MTKHIKSIWGRWKEDLYTVEDLCALLNLSRMRIYQLRDLLPEPRHILRRRQFLWSKHEILRWHEKYLKTKQCKNGKV